MADDERARFRHEARTYLNHIVGYGELLGATAELEPDHAYGRAIAAVREVALKLRQPALDYIASLAGRGQAEDAPAEAAETLKAAVYSSVYDLVSVVQAARRVAPLSSASLDDVHKVHEAANALVDLLEEREMKGAFEPDSGGKGAAYDAGVSKRQGRILIVDDDQFNREMMTRHLERQGHRVTAADSGRTALEALETAPFDIVLLDVMMPGMNGFQFLEALHGDPDLRDVSVIVVSSLEDTDSMARCIELGAEDYLPRDFEPVILKARIDNLLEKKEYKRQNDVALERLVDTQRRLAAELREGASYVRGLLPKGLDWRGVAADWVFIPSLSLGGDCFSYQQIDDDRLAMFLIDVSGHGIEAALLSVSIMNVLKSLSLRGVDYGSPASVLSRLNQSFRMEDQNDLYFTIWYGVYDAAGRSLTYSGGGCPPAMLYGPEGGGTELSGNGPVIGVDVDAVFDEFRTPVKPGSNLFLFSDGLYEVRTREGELMEWDDFLVLLSAQHAECARTSSCLSPASRIVESVRAQAKSEVFNDDVSVVEFAFRA